MTTEDPDPRRQDPPVGLDIFGPLVQPPPPTGSLTPPAPPPLPAHAPDVGSNVESTSGQGGAHRYEPLAPAESAHPQLGVHLPDGLRTELLELLDRVGGRLREVLAHYRAGTTNPAAVAAAGATASQAIAAELILRIRTILGEPWIAPPGRARPIADTVGALLRTPGLSGQAQQYLVELRARMLNLAESESGRQQEQSLLTANSAALQRELRTDHGVFVCTYPHYWRHPYLIEPNRRLLRLCSTADGSWDAVIDQARAAWAPEQPVLLRVYVTAEPASTELAFHRLLESADHGGAINTGGGRGWFATSLEFLDEIADVLGIEVKAGPEPAL